MEKSRAERRRELRQRRKDKWHRRNEASVAFDTKRRRELQRRGGIVVHRPRSIGRSKYTPHVGAKQRAKGLAKLGLPLAA